MSRWSVREAVRGGVALRTPSVRAQATPTTALVAVFALSVGLGLYVVALGDVTPTSNRHPAGPTLRRAYDRVTSGGVASPASLADAVDAEPEGYEVNATLTAGSKRWTAGPAVPPDASGATESNPDRASRRVSVRTAPGRVVPGRLRVEVWA